MKASFEQALRNAMDAEEASRNFYTLLAESTDDAEARSFLKKMAKEEEAHRKQLAEYAEKRKDLEIPNLPDDNVEMIETMPEWAHADNIDYESSLRMALEAEEHAALYYDAIAGALTPGTEQEVFLLIARTEEQHASNLRKLMK